MKIEVTKAQLLAIINTMYDIDSMLGCGEDDRDWKKNIAHIKRMLKKNNINH